MNDICHEKAMASACEHQVLAFGHVLLCIRGLDFGWVLVCSCVFALRVFSILITGTSAVITLRFQLMNEVCYHQAMASICW